MQDKVYYVHDLDLLFKRGNRDSLAFITHPKQDRFLHSRHLLPLRATQSYGVDSSYQLPHIRYSLPHGVYGRRPFIMEERPSTPPRATSSAGTLPPNPLTPEQVRRMVNPPSNRLPTKP